jgi:hypothetical protein
MRNTYKSKLLLALTLPFVCVSSVKAGNPDRAGQAGATELLINPWPQSSGWAGVSTGSVRGVEAIFGNVAGVSYTKRTEVAFAHSIWMKGSGMSINTLGLTQKVGEGSVLGLSLMSFSFGDIPITTVDQPEGGLGDFNPQFLNISLCYAKAFSNSISGGLNVKVVNESISNVSATGVAIDAGIQYVTGFNAERDNFKIGIALKNIGTPMKFGGDGLSTRVLVTNSSPTYEYTVEQRANGFEIPSLLQLGLTYDSKLGKDHRLTFGLGFTSNSFTQDTYQGGLEYAFKEYFMLRGGYVYEEDIFDDELRTTMFTGPCAGLSIQVPLGKNDTRFGIDYSYRATNPFDGTHTFGAHFKL